MVVRTQGSQRNHLIILKELKGNPSQNDIITVLRKAIEASKIRVEDLLKVVLLQKILAASESAPADLAKVVRIENAVLKSGVPADILCRTINEAVKPRNKTVLEKIRRPLLDIINGATLTMSGQEVQFAQDFQIGITSNIQADENKLNAAPTMAVQPDSNQIPNGFKPDSNRIQTGFQPDSPRCLSIKAATSCQSTDSSAINLNAVF